MPPATRMSGHVFAATPEEVAAMDMAVGPTRPMSPGKRGRRTVPLRDCAHPCHYEPSFFDALIRAVLQDTEPDARLRLVRTESDSSLYCFPKAVTDRLSTFTPDKPEFSGREIDSIAERMMRQPEVSAHYKKGGAMLAVFTVRGEALKATPRGGGREVYYWRSPILDS